MNRRAFMDELERLLSDVPSDERIDALQYYEDYFEDAGYEKEQDIIKELGSPSAVAAIIKRDLGMEEADVKTEKKSEYKDYRSSTTNTYESTSTEEPSFWDKLKQVDRKLWLILFILCLPVTGGTILGLMGAFFGITIGIFACTFAFLVGGFSTIVGGIILIVTGIIAKGILTLGVGLILAAVGLMFFALSSLMCRVVIPSVFRGIKKIFGFFFGGEGATA